MILQGLMEFCHAAPQSERNPRLRGLCGLEFRLGHTWRSTANLAEPGRAWQSLNLKLWRFEAVTPLQTMSPTSCPPIGQLMWEGLVMANGLAWTLLRCFEHHWDVFNIMPSQVCHFRTSDGIIKRAFRPSGSGQFGVRALSGHVWVFQTFIIEVEAAINTFTLLIQILLFLGHCSFVIDWIASKGIWIHRVIKICDQVTLLPVKGYTGDYKVKSRYK
jgi:hypothetical protein